MIFTNQLTPAESITRASRKLQEQRPELRGRKYAERHAMAEEVRSEIREMKTPQGTLFNE
jgi:hypothetical protein